MRKTVTALAWLAGTGTAGTALAVPVDLSHPSARIPKAEERLILTGTEAGFAAWLVQFRSRAIAEGLSPAVVDRALGSARFDPTIIDKDRNQAEFTKTIWDYLDSAASDTRVQNGREALRRHARLLDRIEATYGVEREVVVAVWGMESNYGTRRGDIPVIDALATLAYDGRRRSFFEGQLIAALRILQRGDVALGGFRGSWAGAMGHTQFIPTSYLAFAVDFDRDGRADIWADDPADSLASTAAYLARSGWTRGQPWGIEVALPKGFDYTLSGKGQRRPSAEWRALGVRTASGKALPDHGAAALLLPAGARGVALLIYGNFRAIEKYNAADAYVIGVGHLSDRLRGDGPFRGEWPRGDRALTMAERVELQQRLARAGFDPGGADGKIGPNTLAALRAWQRSAGLVPDGYASLRVLERLR